MSILPEDETIRVPAKQDDQQQGMDDDSETFGNKLGEDLKINLIFRYDVKTIDELGAEGMKPWLQEKYDRQKHLDAESVHLAVTDM
ncbi:hypothetical protein G9A89_015429 [Geosiphon pyriformis]|nr:hypothetical protein G9A89_015429 [Geosiphon pyriformis]